MQHDPVDMAHAQALHPTWRADDTILARLAQNAAEVPDQIAMRERDHGIWQEYMCGCLPLCKGRFELSDA